MYLFLRVQDSGDLTLLIQRGWFLNSTLIKTWFKLQDERVNNNSFSDDYFKLFEIKFRYLKKLSRFLQNPTRFIEQELDMMEADMRSLQDKSDSDVSFDDVYGWLIHEIGSGISLQTTSVREFDSILNHALKIAKKRNLKNGI